MSVLDVEVEGDMSPEGAGLPASIACGTSHEVSNAGNGFRRFKGFACTVGSSAGGDGVSVDNGTMGDGSLAASSAVAGFSGRFCSRAEDESSESMAK